MRHGCNYLAEDNEVTVRENVTGRPIFDGVSLGDEFRSNTSNLFLMRIGVIDERGDGAGERKGKVDG